MKTVELTPGIRSSILGFGCAPIMGSVDSQKARRALNCAMDNGITHFDLARSYGFGEAEKLVGSVLSSKRDQVVYVSKFGIKANWKAGLLRPMKPIIRTLKSAKKKDSSPESSSNIAATPQISADRFLDRIDLTGEQMRGSLERSLRALGTDYLDYFLIHEPLATLSHLEDLCATANALKAEGKIRAWGLAYMRSQEQMHHTYLDRFDVLQFDNSPGAPGYETVVRARGALPNMFFSPLRGGSAELSPAQKISQLFADFPLSVVLCSMYSEKHIKANAEIASK